MLIQDINFFEQIDSLDGIQGGTSATSEKPGARSSSTAKGDVSIVKTSATGTDGFSVSTVLGPDPEGTEILILEELFPGSGIEGVIDLSLIS